MESIIKHKLYKKEELTWADWIIQKKRKGFSIFKNIFSVLK